MLNFYKKIESKLNYFTVRYKKNGWTPFYVKAKFENGCSFEEPFNSTSYGKAFYKYAMPRCTNCMFKGTKHTGDICVGDFWGVTEEMIGYNKDGVSLLIIQTQKEKNYFR